MEKIGITQNIALYVKNKEINLSAMSRSTGIPYGCLYASLGDKSRNRPLSADEAVLICRYLEKNVESFESGIDEEVKEEESINK